MTNFQLKRRKRSGNPINSDHFSRATTRDLTKILVYLEAIDKPVNKTKIHKDALVNSNHTNDALQWLLNHGLIELCHSYKYHRINYKLKK